MYISSVTFELSRMSCFVTCESFAKGVFSRVQSLFQELLALYSSPRSRSEEQKIWDKEKKKTTTKKPP